MCSNCSGDYENPDMTDWPDRDSTEQEALEAIDLEAEEEERQAERRELDRALANYAAAVKRYGKALVDLGRACDKP